MLEFGSVTTVGATRFLNIIGARARVFELRRLDIVYRRCRQLTRRECDVVHVAGSYQLLSSTLPAAPSGSADSLRMPLPLNAFDEPQHER
jgi:Helix-turn-helix domain